MDGFDLTWDKDKVVKMCLDHPAPGLTSTCKKAHRPNILFDMPFLTVWF